MAPRVYLETFAKRKLYSNLFEMSELGFES